MQEINRQMYFVLIISALFFTGLQAADSDVNAIADYENSLNKTLTFFGKDLDQKVVVNNLGFEVVDLLTEIINDYNENGHLNKTTIALAKEKIETSQREGVRYGIFESHLKIDHFLLNRKSHAAIIELKGLSKQS